MGHKEIPIWVTPIPTPTQRLGNACIASSPPKLTQSPEREAWRGKKVWLHTMSCKFAMTQIVHSQVMCMEDQCFVHQCVWTSYWQNDGDRSADSTITREAICRVSGAGTHLDCAFSSIPINNLLSIFSYFALVSFSTPPPSPPRLSFSYFFSP